MGRRPDVEGGKGWSLRTCVELAFELMDEVPLGSSLNWVHYCSLFFSSPFDGPKMTEPGRFSRSMQLGPTVFRVIVMFLDGMSWTWYFADALISQI